MLILAKAFERVLTAFWRFSRKAIGPAMVHVHNRGIIGQRVRHIGEEKEPFLVDAWFSPDCIASTDIPLLNGNIEAVGGPNTENHVVVSCMESQVACP